MWKASSSQVRASSRSWLASGFNLAQPGPAPQPVPGRTVEEAIEQVMRSMRSSVPMTSLWRIRYTVGGAEHWTDPVPIGERATVPAGAVYAGYETLGVPIVGGPWYTIGGGPKV